MQMSSRLPMQSAFRRNLCQAGLTVTSCALSLSNLLFMEGDDVQPLSTTLIKKFSGLGKAWSIYVLGQHGGLSLVIAASLDCYEGGRPANVGDNIERRAMASIM
jgi:hypothetical protein